MALSTEKDSTKAIKTNQEEYVKNYIEREAEEYLKFMNNMDTSKKEHEYNLPSKDLQKLYINDLAKAYRECNFTYEPKSNLSISSIKNMILPIIETNSVVVVQGPTGSGKTTQIPRLILDANIKKRLHCNIIVTQPRRIAAISIAKRVSYEGGWPLGSLVGYHVGMKHETSSDTRLTYCTTEVLLQQLICRKRMLDYTHVILDEIHERDQDLDFLLLVIKKLLQTNSSLVKIILMSATINVKKFANYFSTRVRNELVPAPIVKIPERKPFEIYTYYLDEITNLGMIPEISASKPRITSAMINFCAKIIIALDQIDMSDNNEDGMEEGGTFSNLQRHAVLIFLPGIYEIEELHTFLSSEYHKSKLWDLVVLHSLISDDEQQRVFQKPSPKYRRIILSTNIAESSVTVPDIKYVIDFCLVKVLAFNPTSNYQSLQLRWASKVNCIQRAGRTGRVMDGRVYRLVPKAFYHNVLEDEGTPEMLRAPLANVVLRAKIFDLDNPRSLLSLSLDPPSCRNLANTILSLKEIGALIDEDDMIPQPFDGKLTDLGRIMAFLPLNIQISKLIMLGHVFGILRDAIILGASMALKDVFANDKYRSTNISLYTVKKKWARESNSDCIATLNVYKTWQNEKANRRLISYQAEKQWAQRNEVQLRTLRELDVLINEITNRLMKLGVKETIGVNKVIWEDWEHDFVLQVILAGAFYPNYFVKRRQNVEVRKDCVLRNLAAMDPRKTVFLRGWPTNQPGYLYAQKLQEIFSQYQGVPQKQIRIYFDTSKRVYVQFREKETTLIDENHYGITDFVYKAIKMRHCEIPIEIDLLNIKKVNEKCNNQNINKFEQSIFFNKDQVRKKNNNSLRFRPELPNLDVTFIPLAIKNIVSPGYFWATLDDKDTREKISVIETCLNAHPLQEFCARPEMRSLVAAPIEKNHSLTYHRGIIEEYSISEVCNIFFIDIGYSSRIRFNDLRAIDNETILKLPPLAFRCTLASLRPLDQANNIQRRWSKISREFFKNKIYSSKKIFGEIYSVVDSNVNLELIIVNNKEERLNINEHLIEEGYATRKEENYMSKYNHDLRTDNGIINAMSPEEKLFYEEQQYEDDGVLEYPDPPKKEDCDLKIRIQGPYSPLEMELTQLTTIGKSKKISIEMNSVNSVLLDENVDQSTQLLIAQSVNQLFDNDKLILRNTTLLPNIPGLSSLLALIFAPRIELRRSPLGTYYTGALCGLGPIDDYTGRSIFPDHDMEIQFDVEILIDDLREINKLRHWINVGMQLQQDNCLDYVDNDEHMIICQNRIKNTLMTLRDRRRRSQHPVEIDDFDKWNRYDASMFLHPARGEKKNEIYSLHKALKLREKNDELEEMVRHLAKLQRLANEDARNVTKMTAFCKLCKVETFNLLDLRGHLYSQQHIKNEDSLQIPNLRDYYYYYY